MKNKLQTGYFGEFGGAYASEELKRELDRVYEEYLRLKKDKDFRAELPEIPRLQFVFHDFTH